MSITGLSNCLPFPYYLSYDYDCTVHTIHTGNNDYHSHSYNNIFVKKQKVLILYDCDYDYDDSTIHTRSLL